MAWIPRGSMPDTIRFKEGRPDVSNGPRALLGPFFQPEPHSEVLISLLRRGFAENMSTVMSGAGIDTTVLLKTEEKKSRVCLCIVDGNRSHFLFFSLHHFARVYQIWNNNFVLRELN